MLPSLSIMVTTPVFCDPIIPDVMEDKTTLNVSFPSNAILSSIKGKLRQTRVSFALNTKVCEAEEKSSSATLMIQ